MCFLRHFKKYEPFHKLLCSLLKGSWKSSEVCPKVSATKELMFMATNLIFRSFWMKNHLFLFNLPLRKMLLLSLATFFYWPLPLSVGSQKDRIGQDPARLGCVINSFIPWESAHPLQPWVLGQGSGLCVPHLENDFTRVQSLKGWFSAAMQVTWRPHAECLGVTFCLWTHDLAAVGLEQVVSVWDHDLGGFPDLP